MRVGVALNPGTPTAMLDYVLDVADLVLVMSVNPGFGGQTFIPATYAKLVDLKNRIGERPLEVSVDGGVKLEHCRPLALRGATTLVAGSAIFSATDPAAEVRRFRAPRSARHRLRRRPAGRGPGGGQERPGLGPDRQERGPRRHLGLQLPRMARRLLSPSAVPTARMLPYYAERFRTVEINNTFYRMPTRRRSPAGTRTPRRGSSSP